MPTTDQIQTTIDNGKLYTIKLLGEELPKYQKGCGSVKDILPITRLVRALQFQLNAEVIDKDTNTLYTCLYKALGGFGGTYTIDPDVINPGGDKPPIIIVEQMNDGKIPFATTDDSPSLTLASYQANYAASFGNNPLISLYQDNGTPYPKDMQVPDTWNYQDGDPNKPLLSITWDFAIGTSGYIQIYGKPSGSVIPPINPNPPIIDAGVDQNITLPTSSVTLTGTGSNYNALVWTQVSGPITSVIATSNALITNVTGLSAAGTYVFKLTATNIGNVRSDNVSIVVAAQIDYVFSGIKADITPLSEASIQIGTQTPITANTNYNINFGSFGSPQFAWFAELATEPIKTVWTDTTNPLNTGGIGGGGNLFGTPVLVGVYRFYITNYATIISNPFIFTQ